MMRIARQINYGNREDIVRDIMGLPVGSRVTLQAPRRTSPQNRLMWVLLNCFADQVTHYGRKYSPDVWKSVFMHALGKSFDFVPSLSGEEVVALGYSSSDLDKAEMSDLIELMFSEGVRIGVNFDGADRPDHKPATIESQKRISGGGATEVSRD